MDTILEKSSMAFKLPKGQTLVISDVDVKKLAQQIWVEIMLDNPQNVLMIQDIGYKRAEMLYEVYKKEKNDMTEEMKHDCLIKLIKYITDDDYELTNLKEKIEQHKKLNS